MTGHTPWSEIKKKNEVSYTLEELMEELMRPQPWYKELRYSTRRKIRAVLSIPRRIKWFWQRGRRGYSDADTWSFDWYLSSVIAGGVSSLRERGLSYPNGLTWEEWDAILQKIENTFGYLHGEVTNLRYESEAESEVLLETFEEGMALFALYFWDLWD